MNAARSFAAVPNSAAISLDAYRPARRFASRQGVKVATVFVVCLLGLVSSFVDTAVARSSFLLIDAPGDSDGTGLDSVAVTLAWATLADIAIGIGIVLVGYCLLSRPSAEVVPLHPRRNIRKP